MTVSNTFEVRDVRLPSGEQLRVWQTGSGAPLLFLHGFEGHPGQHPFLEALAASHTTIAPVHPGFEDSDDLPSIEDITDLALLYRALIEATVDVPVALVGHSMGAMIAAEVAALSPHLVRKLVLLNPFGLWLEEAQIPDLFVMTPGELRRATWAMPPEPSNVDRPAPPDKAAMVRRYRNLGAASRYLWPIPDRGLRKRARYITAPALALFGADDGLIPVAYAPAWESAIPGCAAEVIDGGHMLPYEDPGAISRRIDRFLGE